MNRCITPTISLLKRFLFSRRTLSLSSNSKITNSSLHQRRQLLFSSASSTLSFAVNRKGRDSCISHGGGLGVSSDFASFPKVIHERDWLVALKAEEMKKVKEVLLLKSISSPSSSSSSTATTTATYGLERTEKGELSVCVNSFGILTKSLLPLLDKYHGLIDIDKRYRQSLLCGKEKQNHPYIIPQMNVDMIANLEVADVFRARAKAKLQRRRQELTQTTPNQPVDDEAVYYKVASECPKGRVYSLRSLRRKNRRYVDPDASTSQHPQGVVGGVAGDGAVGIEME
ncbi:hypothetical protein Syun_031425 [Stephania yunnanensis]|uniref:Uncharacterized protein n=1 Tax=Stephania yunnanensis TaxID=152371 RepID=A0AAP0HEI8_9MAGN